MAQDFPTVYDFWYQAAFDDRLSSLPDTGDGNGSRRGARTRREFPLSAECGGGQVHQVPVPRGNQGLCVWMQGIFDDIRGFSGFHNPAQIHHGNTVGNIADHTQIMGNKQIGKLMLRLQRHQKIQHLGLDRHVKGADGLITNDKFRAQGNGAGNINPLPLTS